MLYTYEYPRPMVTTDILVVDKDENVVYIVLVRRSNSPFKDYWALPGGFVDFNESLIDAARRELFEETGIAGVILEQLEAFGDAGRDPRGHCVSVVYTAFTQRGSVILNAGDDAKDVRWFSVNELPPLAFDHELIIRKALTKLQ